MRSLLAPLTFGLSGNLLRLFYTIFLWELGFGLYINNMLTVYLKDHGMTEARTGLVLDDRRTGPDYTASAGGPVDGSCRPQTGRRRSRGDSDSRFASATSSLPINGFWPSPRS